MTQKGLARVPQSGYESVMAAPPESDLADLMALVPGALLLVDATGTLLYLNTAAKQLIARTGMLGVAGGILSFRRKDEDRELREALEGLSASRPTATICLRNREGLPVTVIDLHRLSSGSVAVCLASIASRAVPSLSRLRRIFGLTPAEARVAAAMLTGQGIQTVAQEHGVAPETVRSQAKRIRSKTGARSQSQLLGILAAIGSDFGPQ